MKRITIALIAFCLVGLVAYPTTEFAATSSAQQQAISRTVITQDPVEPDAPVEEDEITLVIDAPDKVKAGDLVVLSVEGSNAASFEWKILPSTNNFLVIDEGRRAVFSCGEAAEFIFIVAAAKDNKVRVECHKLVVTGPPQVANGIESVIAALCDRVDSPAKRDDALLLSQSFEGVASAMEEGTWTPLDIAKATKRANKKALGDREANWQPFAAGLSKALKQMAEEGKLNTTEAHIEVWQQIAAALRDYAEQLD